MADLKTEQERMLRDIRNDIRAHNKIMERLSDRIFSVSLVVGCPIAGIWVTLLLSPLGG